MWGVRGHFHWVFDLEFNYQFNSVVVPPYTILLLYIGPTFVLALSLLICFLIIGPGRTVVFNLCITVLSDKKITMRYRLFSLGTDLAQQVNLLELIDHSLSREQ